MQVLLVNKTNYDQDWAAETLIDVIRPDMRALIMPLSYDEGWSSDAGLFQDVFARGSDYHYDLERPLRSYGIPEKNIRWIDFHRDDPSVIREQIAKADILCLVGSDPMECMERIEDLGLKDALVHYRGILIAVSAASKILQDMYYATMDESEDFHYEEGLGILSDVDLDIHYFEDRYHLAGIIHSLEERGVPQIILPDTGGVLIDSGHVNLLGNAFVADVKDLDEVYELYNEVRKDD